MESVFLNVIVIAEVFLNGMDIAEESVFLNGIVMAGATVFLNGIVMREEFSTVL